jgi:hypothetical protein
MKPRNVRTRRLIRLARRYLVALFATVVVLLLAFLVVVFVFYHRALAVVGLITLIPSMLSLSALAMVLRHHDYIVQVGDWSIVDKVLQPTMKTWFITMSGIALAFVNQSVGGNTPIDGPSEFQILIAIATITVVGATSNAFDATYAAITIGRDRKAARQHSGRSLLRHSMGRQGRRTGHTVLARRARGPAR